MNTPNENVSMALFCDFENVALGVRDTKYQKFDIRPVLERLLLKGSIVVKKAYCDWERYKEFKAPMHEANFELIEIPHVRQSGKNSADIRLVVDALDFCYTKSHVNTFVIISGDSDFSPLVSKLRENNKKVIGVGVKQSTSDLLIANCDEFIFYDDLAREGQRAADARRDNRGGAANQQRRTPDEERRRKEELEARKTQAVEMVAETFEDLMAERGDSGKIWASALKDALKRRRPDFNESYYGFRAFGNLLDEAQSRGLLEVGREENAGTYVYRDSAGGVPAADRATVNGGARTAPARQPAVTDTGDTQVAAVQEESGSRSGRKSRGGRKSGGEAKANRQAAEQGSGDVSGENAATSAEAWAAAAPGPSSQAASEAPAAVAAAVQTPAAPAADVARQTEDQADAARVDAMRADALARAQAPKPFQPSRLPPMPKPLPQARQPLPAVNIAEWTFAEPAAESRRESSGKAPAKVSDPFEGGMARAAARDEASSPAADSSTADKPAAKRAASRSRAPAKKTAAKTATAAPVAAEPVAAADTPAPAKPASKTAGKAAAKAAPRARRASKKAEES